MCLYETRGCNAMISLERIESKVLGQSFGKTRGSPNKRFTHKHTRGTTWTRTHTHIPKRQKLKIKQFAVIAHAAFDYQNVQSWNTRPIEKKNNCMKTWQVCFLDNLVWVWFMFLCLVGPRTGCSFPVLASLSLDIYCFILT